VVRELITFEVEGQVFGLDIMSIREIRAWSPTTRLPRVPHYVAGVVNLRGTVLPVIDLAARLGWRATEPTRRHAIIVTQFGPQIGGWIVDSVSDIVTVPANTLQPPPTAAGRDTLVPFLEGLAAINDQMVMVLNLAALIESGQFESGQGESGQGETGVPGPGHAEAA
jgi:purine-binding chemotaxis protein CheW